MEAYQLDSRMPDPMLPFKPWMDQLMIFWLGYGGCDAPEIPQDQWMPSWLPRPGNDYDPYNLASLLLKKPGILRVPRNASRHPSGDALSASLGQGTHLSHVPRASAIFYRYMRIVGECGETAYDHAKHWRGRDPWYPFPPELVAAIDLGRRTCLFQSVLGDTREVHLKNLAFFSQLHILLTAHP